MSEIMQAISEDNYLQVKKLIKDGVDLNQIIENEDNENDEPLIFYALHKKCSFDLLKLMIDNGVDIEYTNREGVSLLDEAIVHGNIEFITYLLKEKKLDVNKTKRKSGLTPLIQAACYGNIDLVKLLISFGADINKSDNLNLTAIDYARKLQQKKMHEFLKNLTK
jgi:ankyrin repeat protein